MRDSRKTEQTAGKDRALPDDELLELASSCRLLDSLDGRELSSLSNFLRAHRLAQGKTLFKQGEASSGIWFLIEGSVDVLKESSEGNGALKKITTIRHGQALGEASLMDGRPHSATAVSASDCVLLHLSSKQFQALLDELPRLGITLLKKIGQQLAGRLRQTTGKLVDHLE